MKIGGVQKTSLLDFPEKISAIVFTQGCNFRCGYCHNPDLIVFKQPALTNAGFFNFLRTRRGKLDGVVITGGEPCLQKDLLDFIKEIKSLGFLVKLDTNGSFPHVLEQTIPYLDYIAMDIKAPLEKYKDIVDINIDTLNIKNSINIIMSSNVDYEFRTTVVKTQLSIDDFCGIANLISGAKRYYLQKFVSIKTFDKNFMNLDTYSEEEFKIIISILSQKINNVYLR